MSGQGNSSNTYKNGTRMGGCGNGYGNGNGNGYGNGNGNGYGNGYGGAMPFDMKSILELTFRRKWLILSIFMIVAALSIYKAATLPYYYVASAVIEFRDKNQGVEDVVKTRQLSTKIGLFKQRLMSRTNIEKVMRKAGIGTEIMDLKEYEKTVRAVAGSIKLARTGVNALKILFKSRDPLIAKNMIDVLLSNYIEEDSSSRKRELATSIDFLSAQLETYYQKIQDGEAKLREIRLKRIKGKDTAEGEALRSLMNMPGMYRYGTERMADMQFKLVELDTQLAVLKEKKAMLEKEMKKAEHGKTISIAVETPKTARMKKKLEAYELQLEDLLIRSTESHPMVVELRKNIRSVQNRIRIEMSKPVEGAEAFSAAWHELTKRMQELNKKIEEIGMEKRETMVLVNVYGKGYQGLNRDDMELIQVIRNNRINTRLTELLLSRLESLRMTQQLEVASRFVPFVIVDPPVVPQIPVKRKAGRTVFMGFIFAFVLSGGLIYVMSVVDQSVKKEDDIGSILHLPALAIIPAFEKKRTTSL